MAIYIDALFALQATIPPQRCGGMRGEGIGVGKSNEMHDLLGDKRSQTKCTICLGIRELSPRASSHLGESREVTREPHAKGDAPFLHSSRLRRSLARSLAAWRA